MLFKKISLVILFIFIFAFPIRVFAVAYPINGLVGYWSFDNQSNLGYDDSGNNHQGALYGNSTNNYTTNGAINGALVLTSSNDGILIPDSTDFHLTLMSVGFWFKKTASQTGVIISKDIHGSSTPSEWQITYKADDGPGYTAFPDDIVPSPTERWQSNESAIINNGEWNHFLYTIDPILTNLGAVYLNGEFVTSEVFTNSAFSSNPDPISIGGYKPWDSYYNLIGEVDEMLIYNRILNENEIRQIATAPVPEPATLLLLGTGVIGFAGIKRKFKK